MSDHTLQATTKLTRKLRLRRDWALTPRMESRWGWEMLREDAWIQNADIRSDRLPKWWGSNSKPNYFLTLFNTSEQSRHAVFCFNSCGSCHNQNRFGRDDLHRWWLSIFLSERSWSRYQGVVDTEKSDKTWPCHTVPCHTMSYHVCYVRVSRWNAQPFSSGAGGGLLLLLSLAASTSRGANDERGRAKLIDFRWFQYKTYQTLPSHGSGGRSILNALMPK